VLLALCSGNCSSHKHTTVEGMQAAFGTGVSLVENNKMVLLYDTITTSVNDGVRMVEAQQQALLVPGLNESQGWITIVFDAAATL